MKKFLNRPEDFVDEMLQGIYRAHPQVTYADNDPRCFVTAHPVPGKVGIVSGGGSGHLPTFLGFVGENMLDGCGVGGVFQSPSAEQIATVTRYVDQGAGVLYLYGNYTGDVMNFDMAAELLELEDIQTRTVLGNDDVASAPPQEAHKRRGVAGLFFTYKAAGAAAAAMKPLSEVARIAEKTSARTKTMGVALSACTVPELGKPGFSIGADEMEIGMGIHGEPGIIRQKLAPADAVVDDMLSRILAEADYAPGDQVAVLMNGLGATPLEELYILFRRVAYILDLNGVIIRHAWLGEFATAMEMAGFSVSLLHLDEELAPLIAAQANTPFFQYLPQ
ncbi:MAG: dihydroxyacetone kinase subunit DhaK [Mangrovicoccus sp.]|nr:dihydroxyacetone kinase subunit DhaK [Mangrovicoccus sp.]